MSAAALYLPQVLATVVLSYLVALSILVTRSADWIKRKLPISFYEEWDGTGAPVSVVRTTRQLANLFEFPVLFYAASAILIAIGLQDEYLPALCWIYAALRWLHALSHIAFNRIWVRTPIFMGSNIVLACIWIRIASLVLK